MSSSQLFSIHFGGSSVSRMMAYPLILTKIHGGHKNEPGRNGAEARSQGYC
jgi:hypothetical protein